MQPTNGIHCGDVTKDRALGELWESNFCNLLQDKAFVPHQKNRNASAVFGVTNCEGSIRWIPLPDVSVYWSMGIASHHEIKHKNATRDGYFGLEEYRVNSLLEFMHLSGQEVYYTIHDHDFSDGRHGRLNDIKHWLTMSMGALADDVARKSYSSSYRNGQTARELTYYWHRSQFDALQDVFDNIAYRSVRVDF